MECATCIISTQKMQMFQNKVLFIHMVMCTTDCSNYWRLTLLSPTYKILSNFLMSRLTPKAEEIIGYHERGFRRNSSTTDHVFCIHQILKKKLEYNEAVYQLFKDFQKIRRGVLYNILMLFCIPMKVVTLIKMCLNETYSTVCADKHFSDMFLIRNGL